ncbi:sodium/glutamate symporter [Endomicrobiia bacterium]|nr:sodium/glutamate symporter [Endomicrobiia bacterium]
METEVINGLLTLKFNIIQTVALGVIMYYFGVFIRSKVHFFVRLSIPASAIGGLTVAALTAFLQSQHILALHFDTVSQDLLMVMFFCTVGVNASYKLFRSGSLSIIAFWVICTVAAIFQNVVGILVAKFFGMNHLMGIIGGSISMMGGLGNAGTFGVLFENTFGVNGAVVAGITCATFGMIAGSALGGPLSEWIIKKHKITTPHAELISQSENNTGDKSSEYEEVGTFAQEEGFIPSYSEEKVEDVISGPHLMKNLSWVLVAMGFGSVLSFYFNKAGIILPTYLATMIIAVLIRSIGDVSKLFEIDTKAVGMVSDISLAIFVTMVISALNLKELTNLALPILLMLVIQMTAVVLMAYFLVFKLLGKDYESTVMAAGFVGFGLGATPNALVNMHAISAKHGAPVKAFFVVPIVSAFLIDFTNAIIILFFAKYV